MTSQNLSSKDFRRQLEGYGLTTANILYRRPDHPWLLQTYGTFPGWGTPIGGWCGSTIRDVTGGTQGLAEPLRPRVGPPVRSP
jgi:hypothetical protein